VRQWQIGEEIKFLQNFIRLEQVVDSVSKIGPIFVLK
jgi:hypothetical protein